MEFISLQIALSRIAACVSVPEKFISNMRADEPSWLVSIRDGVYKRSFAAGQLHQSLTVNHKEPLNWFTIAGGMGFAKHSDDAKADGLQLLRHEENQFPAWWRLYLNGRDSGRWSGSSPPDAEVMSFHAGNMYLDSEIGFNLAELVAFLDQQRIPHPFVDLPANRSEVVLIERESTDGRPQPDSEQKTDPTSEDDERRDALHDPIDKAIVRAGGSHRTAAVWQQLKELALAGELPFTGATDEIGGLVYNKDKYLPGEPKTMSFTKGALEGRLIRRWRASNRPGARRR